MAGDILPAGTISFTRVGLEISPPPASESTSTLVVIAISKFFGDGSSPISSKINKANYYSIVRNIAIARNTQVAVVPQVQYISHREVHSHRFLRNYEARP